MANLRTLKFVQRAFLLAVVVISSAWVHGVDNSLDYPTFPSQTLMRARALSDFFNTGSTNDATMVPDTDQPYGEAQAVHLGGILSNTTTYRLTNATNLAAPIDCSNGSLVINYKPISDFGPTNHWGSFELRVYSAGTPASPGSNYHFTSSATAPIAQITTGIDGADAKARWQTFSIHTSQLDIAGTGSSLPALLRFEIRTRGTSGFAPAMLFTDVLCVPDARPRGALLLTFDDEYSSPLTVVDPILSPIGVGGTLYPGGIGSPTGLNTANKLTNAQLTTLLATNRWQLASQTLTTEDKTTFDNWTVAQRNTEFQGARNLARTFSAYIDSADGSYFSLVGANDSIVRPQLMSNFRTLRTYLFGAGINPYVLKYAETFPFGDRYNIRAIAAGATGYADLATGWNAAIDGAVATKGVAILVFHNEFAVGDSNGKTAQDYIDALTAIRTRYTNNPGQFDILTMRSLLNTNWLLERDLNPASNDNSPMWLEKAA